MNLNLYRRFAVGFFRSWSSSAEIPKCSEQQIRKLLSFRFPHGNVKVLDVSGGCGDMFEVSVESKEFEGLTILKQHKLITELLKKEIKDMHGVRIHTSVPK